MKSPLQHRLLRLESLETRTLLAAASDPETFSEAIASTGDYQAELNINRLLLVGTGETDITIDLNELPSFVTSLWLGSFANVTITGHGSLSSVGITYVSRLEAPGLDLVAGLVANNTASVSLHSGGKEVHLLGETMELNIQNLDGTTIFTNLRQLKLESESHVLLISNQFENTVIIVANEDADVQRTGEKNRLVFGDKFLDLDVPDPRTSDNDNVAISPIPVSDELAAFLSRVRDLTQAKGAGQQLLFDFLAHEKLIVVSDSNQSADQSMIESTRTIQIRSENRFEADDGRALTENQEARDLRIPTLGELELARADNPESSRSAADEIIFQEWTPWGQVESAPATTEVIVQDKRANQPLDSQQPFGVIVVKLDDQRPTAGDYILQRIASEFLPGQRNAVLLVDPKPSRSRFGSGEDPLSDYT